MEVLSYVNEGLTNPEIAHRLGVTERTVKVHCQEVFDRLGVSNRTAAVVTARRLGLFAVNAATR
jgi:DNA-binding NarL/FixJ family response regulator